MISYSYDIFNYWCSCLLQIYIYISAPRIRAMPWLRRLVAGLSLRWPGFAPGQSMWDLWWTKWHWDRVFSEFFGFSMSVSFHRPSQNSYHLGVTHVRFAVNMSSVVFWVVTPRSLVGFGTTYRFSWRWTVPILHFFSYEAWQSLGNTTANQTGGWRQPSAKAVGCRFTIVRDVSVLGSSNQCSVVTVYHLAKETDWFKNVVR
jgi:hypothetical protein